MNRADWLEKSVFELTGAGAKAGCGEGMVLCPCSTKDLHGACSAPTTTVEATASETQVLTLILNDRDDFENQTKCKENL